MLPLDDLLAVVREFITPNVSRSGLDRCLRRHGVGSLKAMQPKAEKPGHKPFKSYEPGFVHLDVKYLPQMPDENKRRYLFVAIDRATRWVFVAIYPEKTAAAHQGSTTYDSHQPQPGIHVPVSEVHDTRGSIIALTTAKPPTQYFGCAQAQGSGSPETLKMT